jgi:hypothetical protein
VATKKSVKPSARNASVQLVEVTLRRLGKPVGDIPAGRYILVINPKVFSSTANWLGGVKATFESKEAAIAGAAKLGGRVAA